MLHEDRRSVANLECHALGLVPICLRNPQLHIERRVNLWRNILLKTGKQIDGRVELSPDLSADGYARICTSSVSDRCCEWLTEAYALSAPGMPANSFSLLLDGDPAIDQSAFAFELIKEDAAWHVAQTLWFIEKSVPLGLALNLHGGRYMSKIFPHAINDIVEGRSLVRCNFPIGSPYQPDRIFERNRHLSLSDSAWDFDPTSVALNWEHAWYDSRRHTVIRPLPPLSSSLIDLALEELLTEEELERSGTIRVEWDTRKPDFMETLPGIVLR